MITNNLIHSRCFLVVRFLLYAGGIYSSLENHTGDKEKNIHFVATLIFVVYFSYLQCRLFFFAYGGYYRFYNNGIRYNIIPFKTIITYIEGINNYNSPQLLAKFHDFLDNFDKVIANYKTEKALANNPKLGFALCSPPFYDTFFIRIFFTAPIVQNLF